MKFIFVCLLPVIFYGCSKIFNNKRDCHPQPYYTLSSAVKQWFPYNGNQLVVFVNAFSQQDTLQLRNFFSGDDEVWNGDECPFTQGQFLRGNFIDVKTNDTIQVELAYTNQFFATRKTSRIHFFEDRQALIEPTAYNRFESSLTLNGKQYASVLVAECAPANNCPVTSITKFYFSKGKGFVAYERNAVLWTLP